MFDDGEFLERDLVAPAAWLSSSRSAALSVRTFGCRRETSCSRRQAARFPGRLSRGRCFHSRAARRCARIRREASFVSFSDWLCVPIISVATRSCSAVRLASRSSELRWFSRSPSRRPTDPVCRASHSRAAPPCPVCCRRSTPVAAPKPAPPCRLPRDEKLMTISRVPKHHTTGASEICSLD